MFYDQSVSHRARDRPYCRGLYRSLAKELKCFINKIIGSNALNVGIKDFLTPHEINWHFSPPRSPHFDGLWEAVVKSLKHHLVHTVGDALLMYEELLTYLTEIEAILNSRLIAPLLSYPCDLHTLSPFHFLICDSLTTLPDQPLECYKPNHLSMWQHSQLIRQHFWRRWTKEYLQEIIMRTK